MNQPEAFVWTCALEQPVYVLFLRKRFDSWWAPCLISLGVNALTHPVLWLALSMSEPGDVAATLMAELIVVVVEALALWLILRRRMKSLPAAKRALLASAAANVFSFLAGIFLQGYLGF